MAKEVELLGHMSLRACCYSFQDNTYSEETVPLFFNRFLR